MDSAIQSIFRRLCTVKKLEDFRLPVSRPDDVSSRPEAHLSPVPSFWTTRHTFRTPDRPASSVRTTCSFRPDPYTVSRSFCSSLHSSERFSSTSGHLSVLERFLILSKFQEREDQSTVQLIWKLSIRLQPSGRLPLMVRTRVLQIWKLCVEELSSGHSSPLVRTRKALYGNYLPRTCNRSDVSVSPSKRGS
jgi:hypothetical protein